MSRFRRYAWKVVAVESRKGRAAEFVGYTHLGVAFATAGGLILRTDLGWLPASAVALLVLTLLRLSLVSVKTIGFAALVGLVFWALLGAGAGFLFADVVDARALRPIATGIGGLLGGGLAIAAYGTYFSRALGGERDSIVPSSRTSHA